MSEKTPDEMWQEFSALYESIPPNDPLEELARRAAGGDLEALSYARFWCMREG